MASLWERIQALTGQSLTTPKGQVFDVVRVTDVHVEILLQEKGRTRTIPRSEFAKVEAAGLAQADVRPNQLRKAGFAEGNPAHLATIIGKALEGA